MEKILKQHCFRVGLINETIKLNAKDIYPPALKQLLKLKKVVSDIEKNYPLAERYVTSERLALLSAIDHVEDTLYQARHKKRTSKPVWPNEYLILVIWIATNRKLISNFELNELRNFLKSDGKLEFKLKSKFPNVPLSFPILRESRKDEGETDWLARLRQDYIRQLFRKNTSKTKSLKNEEILKLENEYFTKALELLAEESVQKKEKAKNL
ncbi:MAG: hypothetical protein ACK5V3_11825 [Bdellovibrionales bacterium]